MYDYILAKQWVKQEPFYIEGDIIYGQIKDIPLIYKYCNDHPDEKFTVVTEGGDWGIISHEGKILSIPGTSYRPCYEHKIPNNIVNFYSTNADVPGNVIKCLPIGITDSSYVESKEKDILILASFDIRTNLDIRLPIYHWCCTKTWITKFFPASLLENRRIYFDLLSRSKFAICPPGNGIDCYRTWECLYCNTIPIVIDVPLYQQFSELPIFRIEKIYKMTEDTLNQYYSKDLFKSGFPMLDKQYWTKLFRGG